MKNIRRLLPLLLLLVFCTSLSAQKPKIWTSSDIHEGIQKLNFLGSALYVAAHPDDENTRLISYLSNEVKANTAYLSLTRGDGGQNLIGPEIRELLGIIRSQELLAARRTDGGQQFFSRANDFGYSKHPDETLKIWNKDEVLSDVVWIMRKFQPDIIVNRFKHDTPGSTHGHHTSSAMLSYEAFDLVNNRAVYPEQLEYVDTWQPKRLFFNTSWWFYGSEEAFKKADKGNLSSVDVGVFFPMKGESNTEIAARSRSQHKSQGFGSEGARGSSMEYVELLKGSQSTEAENLFAGINTSWTRVKGGVPIGKLVQRIEDDFSYENPAASVPQLVEAYRMINALPESYWRTVKLKEVKQLIEAASGLYLEAVADDFSATPGQEIEVELEMTKRLPVEAKLHRITMLPMQTDTVVDMILEDNAENALWRKVQLPGHLRYTNPYWLNEEAELGMYTVKDQQMRGLPETPRALQVQFDVEIAGEPMTITKDIVFKRRDPVKGEVYRPFEVTPPVFANIASKVYVFANEDPKPVQVVVKSGRENVSGTAQLEVPKGWRVEPEMVDFELALKGKEQTIAFNLYPSSEQSEGYLKAAIEVDGETYTQELVIIDYDHIPTQTVLRDSKAKVVRIDLKKEGDRVAYIMGAGDEIPESLEQVGYQVDVLEDSEITLTNLNRYDAVIMGVRAYNTVDRLKFHQSKLMDYVKGGGTMIVQYNTNRRLVVPMEDIAPYPLKISRDRVTVEEAPVRFLAPAHEVLNHPNKITEADFEGWVQERGLYFPDEWDEAYTAVLSSNDPEEDPADGGLLVAQFGEGHFVYTGYSWFRELPAGVPGAYRLFTNLISLGEKPRP